MRKLRVFFSFAFVAVVAAGLGACGGDDDSSLRPDEQPDDVIASVDDLGDCTARKAGDVELVGDTSYVCAKNDGKYDWTKVSQTEDDSESSNSGKSSSSNGKKTESSSSKSKSSDSGKEIATNSSSSTSTSLSSSRNDKGGKSSSSMSSSSLVSETVDPSTVVMGTMTDERDGRTYKTVTIGTQTWMAENLNYAYLQPTAELDSSSFCYKDSVSYCEKYGRLYLWSAAMDSAGTWSTNGKGCGFGLVCSPSYPVRGVCPEGWHLPDTTEWKTLFAAVGGRSMAGKMLKSTNGWNGNGNGTDAYAFSAMPTGQSYAVNEDEYLYYEGDFAHFWSSTEGTSDYFAWVMILSYYDAYAFLNNYGKFDIFSVRCIKD